MNSFVPACRAIAIAAVLVSSAALAHASHRTGTALEEPVRAHAPLAVTHAGTPSHAAAAYDDSPGLKPCVPTVPGTTAVHAETNRMLSHPTLPAAPDHRGEKHERGRTTPNGVTQVHRPQAQRGKGQVRNTPATPGMGLLLRFGTNAGLEISSNEGSLTPPPLALHSGRAPPLACCTPTPAPAALPRTPYLAVSPRGQRPTSSAGAPQTQPTPTSDRFAFCVPPRALPPAPRFAATSAGRSPERATEQLSCSRAARLKGATACLTPPFGGCNA